MVTWNKPLENYKQKQAEAAAIRAELHRQESSPDGQIRLELEQLKNERDQIHRKMGAQALIEAQKLQSTIPGLRTETALLMATRGQ